MNKNILKIIVLLFVSTSMSFNPEPNVYAQGDKIDGEKGESTEKEPDRKEKIERIERILRSRSAVREAVGAELLGDKESGEIRYQGNPVDRLSDVDLDELLAEVVKESRAQQMKNMERIQKQLQQVENVRKMNENIRKSPLPVTGGNIVNTPVSPPRTVPVSTPRVPPQAPRTR